ncbi:Odorant receptor 45b [Frankliniella fusca]|uniref:Odorant receptor 45b n=1 Tax=Frankliniella fusca TaxID=407009 RepID=A0AAE1GZS6_9NEOP|nr:Odorant receptor 45b [Frankliniella fusca]
MTSLSPADEGAPRSLQRLWILVHGGNATAALSALLSVQCLLDAVVHLGGEANRSTQDAMNATIMLCGACYQRFWARDRQHVRDLLADLLQLTRRLEGQQAPGPWALGEAGAARVARARRTALLLSVCRWAMILDVPVALVFMVTWPLISGRLTFPNDHLPAVGSASGLAERLGAGWLWFGAQYALQSTAISCSFFCFAGLQVVHVTLAMVGAALLRTLADTVQVAGKPDQLRAALDDHRQLLEVLARFSRVFERPLFHIHCGALGFALLATTALVHGHHDLYVLGLWPIAFAYTSVLGLEGDLLQESSELMLHAAFDGPWLEGERRLRRDVLLLMLRASKPVTIRAAWLGDLSLPRLHGLLNSWYSFTQLFIRLS